MNKLHEAVKQWVDARNATPTGMFGLAEIQAIREAERNLETVYLTLENGIAEKQQSWPRQ